MSKTIIVSNRLPVSLQFKKGRFESKPSVGGLATGLGSVHKQDENIWIGWPGNVVEGSDQKKEVTEELGRLKMTPVFLSGQDIELYYEGFSNETIWPAFHYFTQFINFDSTYWEAYHRINGRFCEAILEKAEPEDTIWVHDYQLLLLPMMLREALPGATIAFFQHIPFPSYEIMRMMPWRRQLLEGMVGADLIGFHTYDDMRHFLSAVGRLLGLSNESGYIQTENRLVNVDAFPMGIDYDKFAKAAVSKKTLKKKEKFAGHLGDEKLLLTIDRLDYSKGIPQRILAFEKLLDDNREFHGKVSMIMIVVPSRAKVQSYKDLKNEIDTLVGRVNSKFSTLNWVPIHYFYRSFPFDELSAFYSMSDIALVTPLRDGMNLVCKEFVASKADQTGVLILSEMAGASKELVDAILVNPNDIQAVEDAMITALTMPEEEQKRRLSTMQRSLKRYDIFQWVTVFMDRLENVKRKQKVLESKSVDNQLVEEIATRFKSAQNPVIFLDYDGTLVDFKGRPEEATPDAPLMALIDSLSSICELVVISGRDRETLDQWLIDSNVNIIAEHGVWLRRRQETTWELYADVDDSWKEEIRQVMDYYVSRTPGAFIEEKHHSLVWHYRKVESGLGDLRMRELFSHLKYIASGHNLQVLEGNMVLEIKRPDINKGRAAVSFMKGAEYDFILALGDDWTDEDTFKALPKDSYTIRVGYAYTQADYNIKNTSEVRKLLGRLLA